MDKNTLKKIVVGTSINREIYDACVICSTETPLADIHLFNGACTRCYKPKRKYTDKQLIEMVKLDVGFKDE